jgi:YfiH family protein
VHGARVVAAAACRAGVDADAVVVRTPADTGGRSEPIGIVTADCVPVLAAAADGRAATAIHAGWRGLAAGVVSAGIDALRREAGGAPLLAVVGPHIGACCYEVDAPVVDALRYLGAGLDASLRASRPGHWWLDLGRLTRTALLRADLAEAEIGTIDDACTSCDAQRFHSYRRDGPESGRLVHWIAAGKPEAP